MKPYPEKIDHHGIVFTRNLAFRASDMQFELSYKADGWPMPPLATVVPSKEDIDSKVDGLVEQVHAFVGLYLANFYKLSVMQDVVAEGEGDTIEGEKVAMEEAQ
jgi:hypothetical protein